MTSILLNSRSNSGVSCRINKLQFQKSQSILEKEINEDGIKMGNHYNNYGFSGGAAAIFAAISWFLIQHRNCKINPISISTENFNPDHLQMFHYIAIITGVILFVLSFFDFAGILNKITPLFCLAAVGIFASGAMMLYATFMSLHISCKSGLGGLASYLGNTNVIDARDEVGITIMVLDILSACLFISAAISFSRTY